MGRQTYYVVGKTVQMATVSACMHLPQESLERDGTRISQPAKPSSNPEDVGPIVRRLMGLPVGCDIA